MTSENNTITFRVVGYDIDEEVHVSNYAYRNLMNLLNELFFLDYFGECGGQGRCATCMVKIEGSDELQMKDIDTKEISTLTKYGRNNDGSRLSCQIQIDDRLNNTIVHLMEDDV